MNVYYGARPVPPGKRRGTLQEALNANQIRYYGAVAIPKEQLNKPVKKKKKEKDLVTEQLKLRRYQQEIKILIQEAQTINVTRRDPNASAKKKAAANKKMANIKKRKEAALARIAKQRAIVEKLK